MRPWLTVVGLLVGTAAVAASPVDSQAERFVVETVTDGLAHPWAMAFLPDGRILVTERTGELVLVDPETGNQQAVSGAPRVDARGQGGLLDVALHPGFATNRWVYLTWSGRGESGNATHVGRGRLHGDELAEFETLFVATPFVASTKHFGSRLLFDDEGHLFVTVGERGERDRAQDLNDHNGSVLRLNANGSVPGDNPFVGRDDALDAIYSYGHRNPQGMALHPDSRRPWIHEHGPRGGDEINIPRAGENFGWPIATHGREYYGLPIAPDTRPGVVDPVHHWTPSIAPSGMAFYTGEAFPAWRGDLFVGALAGTHLARVGLNGERVTGEEELLQGRGWRVRAVTQGPDDFLYLLVDADDAPMIRLRPPR